MFACSVVCVVCVVNVLAVLCYCKKCDNKNNNNNNITIHRTTILLFTFHAVNIFICSICIYHIYETLFPRTERTYIRAYLCRKMLSVKNLSKTGLYPFYWLSIAYNEIRLIYNFSWYMLRGPFNRLVKHARFLISTYVEN